MKIEALIAIAYLDNGEFHQVSMPEGVEQLLFDILAKSGTIKLLPESLSLEMTNKKPLKTNQ